MTDTLGELRRAQRAVSILGEEHYLARIRRDKLVRLLYAETDRPTLQQLATATGLSKQRIHTIVKEGEE